MIIHRRRNKIILACIVLILIGTLTPSGDAQLSLPFVDKIIHFLLFMVLSISISLRFRQGKKGIEMLMWAIMFGLLTEVFQDGVPGRSMDIFDAVADTLGVIAGYYLYQNIQSDLNKLMMKIRT